jgi:ribonuclease BN (tRNA processing enzyme)
MAAAASVRRLILTHYGEESTSEDLDQAARKVFSGEIAVADDHAIFELT